MTVKSNKYKNLKRSVRVSVLLIIYVVYLFILTLSPFEFSLDWMKRLLSWGFVKVVDSFFYFRIYDVVNNILLFIPIGILLSLGVKRKKFYQSICIPLITGAILSGSIEIAQLFLKRSTSFIDFLTNTGSSVLGFYLVRRGVLKIEYFHFLFSLWRKFWIRILTAIFYGLAFAALIIQPIRLNSLETWDDGYHLLIGNEETLDRPWKGEVFLCAIYNRTLRLPEIKSLNRLGINKSGLEERKKRGAVALYTFSEGRGDTVRDVSVFGEPLFLAGEDVHWLEGGIGVEVKGESPLRSLEPARKIVQALNKTSQLTVEVWIRSESLVQFGPARIVSLSENPIRRNFTLGQSGRDVILRVRTPLTGPNGSWISLRAKSVLNDHKIHHLVATFQRGVEELILDGQPKGGMIRGDIHYFPSLVKLGRNMVSRLVFCFSFLFPFSLILYSLFQKWRFGLTLISTALYVFMINLFYSIYLDQAFGFLFFFASLVTAVFGGFVGYVLEDFREVGVSGEK